MGRRGPRKKLPYLEALEGFPGKAAIAEAGIEVEASGEPFVPEHLPDDARGVIEIIKDSMPLKVYSRLDSFLLAAFGMAVAVHQRAAHEIASPRFECVIKGRDKGAAVLSPWLRILNTEAALIASLGDRLGLNPAARAALKLPHVKRRSQFEGLIGQTGLTRPLSN
jgi:phage terminase small subunit